MNSSPMTSTYSMWSLFRNCRKACEYRYEIGLVPREKDPNLSFGSLIHECLQTWHGTRDLAAVIDFIDRVCASRRDDDSVRRDWHLARAMMTGYAARYPQEEFEVVALEKTFEGPIINPATGASSRSFVLAGKVDGIVRIGGDHYILEHKTAATIDADYLERLWTDFQIAIYSYYVEQALGIPITGVIYNVLGKARLQQSKGETEEEYQTRRAELLEKSKTGKTTAKRKLPESDEEFQARMAVKYARAGDVPPRDALSVAGPLRRLAGRTLGTHAGVSRRSPARRSFTRTPRSASTTTGPALTSLSAAPTAIRT